MTPTDAAPFAVTVNGQPRTVEDGTTVKDLVVALGAGAAVAVERNGEIVPAADHAATVLGPGDRLEVVTFVGGG